jgi:hypothetical protein
MLAGWRKKNDQDIRDEAAPALSLKKSAGAGVFSRNGGIPPMMTAFSDRQTDITETSFLFP